MTDTATPTLFTPAAPCWRWRVVLSDGEVRTVEAAAIRVEGGALLALQPAGLVSAWAPGTWLQVEPEVVQP